jgi:hypothetical protein
MIHHQHRMLHLLSVASLLLLLTGCASQGTNSQFIVSVSGNTAGLEFDGQCTAQKAGFWPGESVAQNLDVKGTVESTSQTKYYETTGFFIYCAVANQTTTGTIAIQLLQDGNLVASAQSTSPDKPAIIEFGGKP